MTGETVITIIGNLTADPELRYTQSGLAVANFTIASTPRVFDKASNSWKEGDALFLRCSAWREFAENIAGSLHKGTRVIASGRLVQRSYDDRDGNKRTAYELQVDDIGPSLRWATANVVRVTAGSRPAQGAEVWPGDGPASTTDVWGSSGDVWNAPGQYTDETPF